MNYKNCNQSNTYSPATILFLYSLIHSQFWMSWFCYQEEKLAQEKIPPWELFKKETDKYSQFDDKVGIFSIDLKVNFFLSLCYYMYYYIVTQVLKDFTQRTHELPEFCWQIFHLFCINHMNSLLDTSSFDIFSGNSHTWCGGQRNIQRTDQETNQALREAGKKLQ